MKYLLKILDFFNLLDESGTKLSLTNLAVVITTAKLMFTQATPLDGGAMLATILNYAHKRHIASQDSDDSQGPTNQTSSDSTKPGN